MEIKSPENFDFDAKKWSAWKQRFMRFRLASDLASKSEEKQVSTLIYCMGDQSEDIFQSFNLTDDDAKKFDTVLQKFDKYFGVEKNVIFERAKFNMRCQEPDEPAESFITSLHKLSETCDYGLLRDELIRDRIVAGIRDGELSKKMQLDAKLTLEKAMTIVQQSEDIRAATKDKSTDSEPEKNVSF